jgi:hypothetical protein
MTTLKIELDEFLEALKTADPYDAYTAQPTTQADEVAFDLNKEVLAVFKSLKQRFQFSPKVVLQADEKWTEEAEHALDETDTVDGLEVALMRNPSTLKAYTELLDRNKVAIARGRNVDLFCHFYIGDMSGNMRLYLNVKAQNAGAVIIFLLEKLKAKGLSPGDVIGGFKFPYVRSKAHKRRDVLVIWTDSSHLDALVTALRAVQVPMGKAFLDGPPLTTGQTDLRGVGFAPHLKVRDYSYGLYLERVAEKCGSDKSRWQRAITKLYQKADIDVTLDFA